MCVLTFFTNRFSGLLPRYHVITADGLEPVLTHSMSYCLSADTNFSLVRIWTDVGFTEITIKPHFRH